MDDLSLGTKCGLTKSDFEVSSPSFTLFFFSFGILVNCECFGVSRSLD